jgi:hypothetical protein
MAVKPLAVGLLLAALVFGVLGYGLVALILAVVGVIALFV